MPPLPAFAPALTLRARRAAQRPLPPPEPRRVAAAAASRSRVRAVVQVGSGHFRATVDALGDARFVSPDGLPFRARAEQLVEAGVLPGHVATTLLSWFPSYHQAVQDNEVFTGDATAYTEVMFSTLLELARRAVATPIQFCSYHTRVRHPFDYYKFGFDFASVLVNTGKSTVMGREHLADAVEYARQGHNVIFLSNHQSEGDPYAIDFLFDWVAGCDRHFCENIIFMAGDRVRNDPVVCPFSAGRNLLTVYSKKHINDVPDLREEKLLHNRRTIAATCKLFKEGGKVVWFAPSGGRDRRSKETCRVEVSDFDEGAVDMMRFTALKSGKPSHFYPMSLWTYEMLPPPTSVGGAEIGEERVVNYIPMHMCVGKEIDWEVVPDVKDKIGRRRARCDLAQKVVIEGYRAIGGYER